MSESKDWYVYIVRCKNGALYTGISIDVEHRIEQHNSGKGAKAVKMLGVPVELVYVEKAGTYSAGLKREAAIKKMDKKVKEELLKSK